MQVVLVYLECFRRHSLLKCVMRPKIAKINLLKTPILGFKVVQGHRCLLPPERSPTVLVMMLSKSVSICNRSLARLDDSSRNRAFWRGYPNLMHLYEGLLEPRGSNVTPLKSMFNAIYFVGRLSWSILNGFGAVHSQNLYCSLKSLKKIH